MPVDVSPTRRVRGTGCCGPSVEPSIALGTAARLAEVARALGDPVRLQLVDVLRRHGGRVCVCDLQPLFPISQPTLSHHLRKLREAGVIDVERRGLWAYYFVLPHAFEELSTWLTA